MGGRGGAQVGVAGQGALEAPPEQRGLLEGEAPGLEGVLHMAAQRAQEVRLGVVDVLEHFADAVAPQDVGELRAARIIQVHVHDVRVPEQVVHVAEDLLVGADQEEGHEVRVVGLLVVK